MSRYRRASIPNTSYFFTVVAYRRRPILCDEAIRNALRAAIETVRATRPFVIDAWVLLLDHLHCIWTLPEGDADFSTRWMMITRLVSLTCSRVGWAQFFVPTRTSNKLHPHVPLPPRLYCQRQLFFYGSRLSAAADFMRRGDS